MTKHDKITPDIAQRYWEGLKAAYDNTDNPEYMGCTEAFTHVRGATPEALVAIQKKFPQVPQSFLDLWGLVDGTYHRDYDGVDVSLPLFGSSDTAYYQCSSEQILTSNDANRLMCEFDGKEKKLRKMRRMDPQLQLHWDHWLHFADCIYDGSSSQLFLDFEPTETGAVGQVVMFSAYPHHFRVIAKSFDNYLRNWMAHDFDFLDYEVDDEFRVDKWIWEEEGRLWDDDDLW